MSLILELATFSKFSFESLSFPDSEEPARTYGLVRHVGAALAVPVLDDGNLVLVNQYRFAISRRILEFPAGTLESGESPLSTAKRELAEEACFSAQHWHQIGTLAPCPGYSTELIHIFLAQGLEPLSSPPPRDTDEDIVVLTLSPCQFEQRMAGTTDCLDSKSLAAWFRAKQFLGL